ncbi:tetratricopeptide repeat protein [Streptomyces sp. NPDC047706]|uniref:tetratricopeptide repeat protein n=1 Tax=Streptomyces sp. NPDC047706 TaxID=3365486 RepID=UPI00372341C2
MASEEAHSYHYTAAGMGSVVVGNDNLGSISTNVHVPFLPPDEVEAHSGLVLLPEARDRAFVGREEELAELHRAFAAEDAPGGRTAQVVHGMGGVGKSALALEYAHRYRDHYNPVLRLPADSPEGLTAGLAALADDLNHLLRQIDLPLQDRATWARNWLQCHSGWLLILDNAEHPQDVAALLGALGNGRVLITTRQATGWHARCRLLALDVLPQAPAVELLARLSSDGEAPPAPGAADEPALRDLAAELGCLPIALAHAAAYLHRTRTDPSAYTALLREAPGQALGETTHRDRNERTTARVWHHSLRAVDEEHPRAVHVLRVLAWLAPDRIPRRLLDPLQGDTSRRPGRARRTAPRRPHPYTARGLVQQLGWVRPRSRDARRELTPLEINRALGVLHAYSLIRLDRQSVNVHRLTQRVARSPDPASPFFRPRAVAAARQEASELLLRAATDAPRLWTRERQLLPHLEAFLHAASPADDRPDTAVLLQHVVAHLNSWPGQQGAPAVEYAERSMAAMRRHLVGGRFHPAHTAARGVLAESLLHAGELDRAVALLERDRRRGRRGSSGLHGARRATLARCYLELGEPERAVPLLREEASEARRYGHDPREVLRSRVRLADAYRKAGRPEKAAAMLERDLSDTEATLGELDPDTMVVCDFLAHAYLESGDTDRAVALFTRNLADREQAFGRRHPMVFISRLGLALAWEQAGEPYRAVELMDRNLADAVGLHDAAGHEVLAWHHHQARMLLNAGRAEQAVALHEENFTRWAAAFGRRHPDVLHVRADFAQFLTWRGRARQAVPMLEQCVEEAEEALGASDPVTVGYRLRLVKALREVGDIARAVPLHEQVLDEAQAAGGACGWLTLAARVDCGHAYRDSGDLERAVSVLEEALWDAEAHCGRRHELSLAARSALARAYAATGDTDRAVTMLQAVATDAERFLAPDHPHGPMARRHLAALTSAADTGTETSPTGPAPSVPDQQNTEDHRRGDPGAQPPHDGDPP